MLAGRLLVDLMMIGKRRVRRKPERLVRPQGDRLLGSWVSHLSRVGTQAPFQSHFSSACPSQSDSTPLHA
jgi:hypothetical protein